MSYNNHKLTTRYKVLLEKKIILLEFLRISKTIFFQLFIIKLKEISQLYCLKSLNKLWNS